MRLEIWSYFISMAVFHLLSVLIYSNISFMQERCWWCIYLEFSWKAAIKSVCSCSGYRKRTGQFRLPSASKCTFAPVALSEWNPSKDNSARPSDISSSSLEGSRTSLIFLSWRWGRKKNTNPNQKTNRYGGENKSEKIAVSKRTNCVIFINESALKHAIKSLPTVSDSGDWSSQQNPESQPDTQTPHKTDEERWESREACTLREEPEKMWGKGSEILFFGI